MKIIYIIKSLAQMGGTERVLTDKMNYLSQMGYQITVVTYEQGEHPIVFDLHASIVHYDLNTRFFTLYRYNIFKRAFKYNKLRKKFKKELQQIIDVIQPDIIITTTYSLKIADIILKIKDSSKKIIESHVACTYIKKTNDYKHNILYPIAAYLDYKTFCTLKMYDALVTLTQKDSIEWSRYLKPTIITNPITDYPKQIIAPKCSFHRIICVGRLEEQKGFDLLIEAFYQIGFKYPDWHIDIYGNGSCEGKLKELIKSLNLDMRIKIHPPIKNIYDEYLKSDFFVLSSRFEGFGLVLAEAMSCGKPCVSFDCPFGPSEIITNDFDGLLVKNGDVGDLSSKIEWMINHEDDRIKMGFNARKSAKRYSKNIIMEQWIDLFSKLSN